MELAELEPATSWVRFHLGALPSAAMSCDLRYRCGFLAGLFVSLVAVRGDYSTKLDHELPTAPLAI